MGCICSKGAVASDYVTNKPSCKGSTHPIKQSGLFSGRDDSVAEVEPTSNNVTARLIKNQSRNKTITPGPVNPSEGVDKRKLLGSSSQMMPKIVVLPDGERASQIVAGWPSWLAAVAGEAINGWVPRRSDSFEKLDKIGQGTYSSVYKARDLETNRIVALKKVRFANMDPESVRFMAREIVVLRRLDHPNIMKLEGIITSRVSGSLYLIFEYMEHDLAGILATPGIKLTEPQIKCYMQQLLRGLEHCHSLGVLHRDIKGSNLLIDNNGNLKLADFGLATFFTSPQKHPLTSRVVTLWYRPPELLLGSTSYGVSVDLWSTGCILAELFVGKPIMPGRTEVEQLHKIFKLCGSPPEEYWKRSKLPHTIIFKPQHPYKRCVTETFKDIPSSALHLLDVLLAVEPEARGTALSALQHEFFTTKPLPSDPSSLPKYPPSKELDVKLRDIDSKRRKAVGSKQSTKEPKISRANPEAPGAVHKKQGQQPNGKSASDKYSSEEDGGSGFPMDPSKERETRARGRLVSPSSSSSALYNADGRDVMDESRRAFISPRKNTEARTRSSILHRGVTPSSRYSGFAATRGNSENERSGPVGVNPHWTEDGFDDSSHHLLSGPKLSQKEGHPPGMVSATGQQAKKSRIHFSGPLMPPRGNIEEMLKEHEKQIQQAVRKARIDKSKPANSFLEVGPSESLLHHGRKGR